MKITPEANEDPGASPRGAPSLTPPESSTAPGAGPDPPGDRGLVPLPLPLLLLVEDDWRSHSALRKIFTRIGWEVRSAMTVSGALEMLELGPRGLILDLMLPDGDGLAVLSKVRSDRLAIKVVVTTGVEDRERLDQIRQLQPEALLRKPIDLDELFRALGVDRAG